MDNFSRKHYEGTPELIEQFLEYLKDPEHNSIMKYGAEDGTIKAVFGDDSNEEFNEWREREHNFKSIGYGELTDCGLMHQLLLQIPYTDRAAYKQQFEEIRSMRTAYSKKKKHCQNL